MAKWENKIMLSNFIKQFEKEEITIQECAEKVTEYLRNFDIKPTEYKEDLNSIADDFETVTTVDDFDKCLNSLYNFGDIEIGQRRGIIFHRLAWIDTQQIA